MVEHVRDFQQPKGRDVFIFPAAHTLNFTYTSLASYVA